MQIIATKCLRQQYFHFAPLAALSNWFSSTSENVCIVKAFVTISILLRTLCPILDFSIFYTRIKKIVSAYHFANHFHLIKLLSWSDNTKRLECILLFCKQTTLFLVINDGKCDPEVNKENCKNEASLLTSIYSVSDLEFKGRIFHALKIAKICFNPKFQFLDGRRAPGLNNQKTEQQTKHHPNFQVFSHCWTIQKLIPKMTPKLHVKYSAIRKANTHQQVGLQASDMQDSSSSSQREIFNWQNVRLLWTDCNTWPGMCFDSKLFKKDDNTTELQKQNTAVSG